MERGVLLRRPRPQTGDAHRESKCCLFFSVCALRPGATNTFALSTLTCSLPVAFERMGPANGIRCGPRETAALQTAAGPG